jgi:hypothetical protein
VGLKKYKSQGKAVEVTVNSKEETLKTFAWIYSKSSASVCNVHIVYGNRKSENSQDYAQKPQRNCTFMNSALGQ